MENNLDNGNRGLGDRAILAVAAVLGMFLIAVMAFFLIKYPIPLALDETDPLKGSDLLMIIAVFIGVTAGIGYLSSRKTKFGSGMPGTPQKRRIPFDRKVKLAIWALIYSAAIMFALVYGILPGLIANLK